MLGPLQGLWEPGSTDLGTQGQEEGTQCINVQVVGVDHKAPRQQEDLRPSRDACMGHMHGMHAWKDACPFLTRNSTALPRQAPRAPE